MRNIFVIYLLIFGFRISAGEIILPPELLFVGDGSGQCTYTSIQDAVNVAPPNSEIRVTNDNGILTENIIIDKNLTLKGGYSSCGLAQLDSRAEANRTTIQGDEDYSIVTVVGDNINFEMSGFKLENGMYSIFTPAGGMSISGQNSEINLNYVDLINNTGFYGGGLYLGGDSVVNIMNSEIKFNNSEHGGGIYCEQSGRVNLLIGSKITFNNAINGGGVYTDNCRFDLSSGSDNQQGVSSDGVSLNIAYDFGGGFYLKTSSLYIREDVGNEQYLVSNIAHNTANTDGDDYGDGGGIYAQSSEINGTYGYFYKNKVRDGHGGAVFLDDSAFNILYISTCHQFNKHCVYFEGNRAEQLHLPGDYLGGAFFAFNGSHIASEELPLRTHFIDNRADSGGAIYLSDNSTGNIQNTYFIGNGSAGANETNDSSTIFVTGLNTLMTIRFSTFANNKTEDILIVANAATLDLKNSIIYEDDLSIDSILIDGGILYENCNVMHEAVSIGGAIYPTVESVNPGFVDPQNGNYHINHDSIAVDRCNIMGIVEYIRPDYDGDIRPYDLPGNANITGSYDAGADEYNDVIFKNGFDE